MAVIECQIERGIAHCGMCGGFPCARLGKMGDFSDLNTNHVKERTCSTIASSGFESWYREYEERADLLTAALERYNNGRMKRFLCELFIQQDIGILRDIMHKAEALYGSPKEIGKAFPEIVKSALLERE